MNNKTIYDMIGSSFITINLKNSSLDLRRYGLENAKIGERYALEVDEVSNKYISFKLVKIDE